MQVEYEQTAEDVAALWSFYFRRMPERRWDERISFAVLCLPPIAVLAVGAWLIGSAILTAGVPRWDPIKGPLFLAALGSILMFSLISPGLYVWSRSDTAIRWKAERMLRRGAGSAHFLGPKRLVMSSAGVSIFAGGADSKLTWFQIARVVTDREHVYFFIVTGAPRKPAAHVVPSRAFLSLRDFVEFARLAESYWKAATRSRDEM
jgi:hypothetical protein